MIIDDDSFVREVTVALLEAEHAGFDIEEFVTAEEALAADESVAPDIILLDLMLPGMGGIEAAPALHERYGNTVPIVALTASSDTDLAKDLEVAGFVGVIRKPFVPNQLVERVTRFLEGNT